MCWRWWNEPPLLARRLQDLLGVKVFYFRLVANYFVVRSLEELLATVAQLLANGLLHAGIGEFALSRGLFGHQLHDAIAEDLPGVGVHHRDHVGVLAGLEFGN